MRNDLTICRMYGKANTRTFIAITCLSALSITAVAGCKRLGRRSNAGPTIPCEGTFRSERAPNGGPEHIVTGTVRTTPSTPVTVIDARLGQPMSVADASGTANFSMLINSALPSFVMFQCGVIGDRSRGYATASAPLRMAPRFLPLNTFNRLQCEGRELNVAFHGLSVSVSGEAGAQVTIDDRVLALAGAPQSVAYLYLIITPYDNINIPAMNLSENKTQRLAIFRCLNTKRLNVRVVARPKHCEFEFDPDQEGDSTKNLFRSNKQSLATDE